ncbi:helix-turn-helix domain-containing protein [Salinicola sp. CPA57]|uniref:helix-turn-helix domain-containing protein n=1 Tax=Salinicola sp. CPA57 TaxID=1949080 RepID=UPI000DA26847|nr:helix-turn-helix domain-containing protein [Salinicola sp. CPA57]
MSLLAMSWARQSLKTLPTDVKTPSRLALMLLADYANEQHVCWPGLGTMAEEMGCSKRSVQRAIDLLEERGLVVVESRQDKTGRQQSNRYRLAVGGGCQSDTPTISTNSGEGDNLTPRGDSGDRGRVTPVTPLESAIESTTNPNTHTAGPNAIFDRARQQDDDGQPLPSKISEPTSPGDQVDMISETDRKHPMTLDWEPNPDLFAAQCYRAGMSPETTYEPHQLAKFVAHHAGDPARQYAAAGWIGRFVDWIRNDQRNAKTQLQTGGAHANRRQRTPSRRLTAAEARQRDRQQREQPAGGQCFDGEWRPGH